MSELSAHTGLRACGTAELLVPVVRPANSESGNDVLKGFAILPDGHTRAAVIIKVFTLQHSPLRIYNEVIAHHLAVQCGVPSPYTFPCMCLASDLRSNRPPAISRQYRSERVLGVASIDVGYKKLSQSLGNSQVVEQDILLWPSCARVALFDELLANIDRNASNLIRQGPADYRVIDHERIMFGENWISLSDLSDYVPRNSLGNCLARTIAGCTDEVLQQRLRHYAQVFLREIVLVVPNIAEGLERLCRVPLGTTDNLLTMLNRRRAHLPRLIQFYFEDSNLFRASSY